MFSKELIQLIKVIEGKNKRNKKRYDSYNYFRYNILMRSREDFLKAQKELSAEFSIVEMDAKEIVFYKKTVCKDGFSRINRGPETESKAIKDSEFVSYLNIEKPVISYNSGSIDCEINQFLRNMIEVDNALIVISNIEDIQNADNKSVLLNFIRARPILSPLPIIVITDNQELIQLIIGCEGKDSFLVFKSEKGNV